MINIDTSLVLHLIGSQFPQWASLPIQPVNHQGHDNRSFRLGETLVVRLPSAQRYVAQVEKEQSCLPKLGPLLNVQIPKVIAFGKASPLFPYPWSIYAWIDGETLNNQPPLDLKRFAVELASFLKQFQSIDSSFGPVAGPHNFYRGGDLHVYQAETFRALNSLSKDLDIKPLKDIFDTALASSWTQNPVWVHGDIAVGNLLMVDDHLTAVIDFGSMGIGDPACDYVMAYTLFDSTSRQVFKEALGVDTHTWKRTQGWALWKAVITLVKDKNHAQSLATLSALSEDFGH